MHRHELKARLWKMRLRAYTSTSSTLGRACPLCDVCGEPLGSGVADMHESVVPRRIAMGWDNSGVIMYEYNCHLVHHVECHQLAHANPIKMVAIQIVRYGWHEIQEWIDTLPFVVEYSWHRGLTDEAAYREVHDKAPWILEEIF